MSTFKEMLAVLNRSERARGESDRMLALAYPALLDAAERYSDLPGFQALVDLWEQEHPRAVTCHRWEVSGDPAQASKCQEKGQYILADNRDGNASEEQAWIYCAEHRKEALAAGWKEFPFTPITRDEG